MKQIPLTQGKFAVVDDDDFERINSYKWSVSNNGYAIRNTSRLIGKGVILMHRDIVNPPKGMLVDHIDRDKLNNTRSNLRICNKSQNGMNRNKQSDNTSGYKGVFKHKSGWLSKIKKDGVQIYIGLYKTAEQAAKAYDEEAKKQFGEFAVTNF